MIDSRLEQAYREGTGSVRFVSVPDFSNTYRFGSVRKNNILGSTRFGLRFWDSSWLGLVRFGSFPRPVPAGSEIKRFGSVRFGRVGSFLLLGLPGVYRHGYTRSP